MSASKLSSVLATSYENFPKGRFITLVVLRTTHSETIFRTEGSGEPMCSEFVQAGLEGENQKTIIQRLVMTKRKQVAPERRYGREHLRAHELLYTNPKDGSLCALNTNAPCEMCVDCFLYGFAAGGGGAQKSRIWTEDAFSILPASDVVGDRTINAIYETGTMRDEKGNASTAFNIDSEAIAYLPANAWEEGLTSLDTTRGRTALKDVLDTLPCLDKPFLTAYWRSEASLEIARPLLELEEVFENLAGAELIPKLFETLKSVLEGKRNWEDYRHRMKVLRGAENIAQESLDKLKTGWKYLKGGQAFVKTFIKVKSPEEWDDLQAGRTSLEAYEDVFKKHNGILAELKEFAEVFSITYAPLFTFRYSLFESLPIRDPHNLVTDESEQTQLEPFHLLRYYEFAQIGDFIEITSRATETYKLSFRMRYFDTRQEFVNTEINKLTAFQNCQIIRSIGEAIRPTPELQALSKHLLPGVIICPRTNAANLYQLHKQGIVSYPITIVCNDGERQYEFLAGLSGILTMAMKFKQLRLPDDEVFIAG